MIGPAEIRRNSDQLHILTVFGPNILGIAVRDAHIITSGNCKIATLKLDDALKVVNEKKQWKMLAFHVMFIIDQLYSYSHKLTAATVYEVICNQLVQLMGESEMLRSNISVERYIRDKTHISRSSVMKILSELKTGGYIIIKTGKLQKIEHLPLKY